MLHVLASKANFLNVNITKAVEYKNQTRGCYTLLCTYNTALHGTKTIIISHNFLSIYLTQAASGKEVIICENFSMK